MAGADVSEALTVQRIGWFSDRDALIDAYNTVAHDLYATTVAAFRYHGCSGWTGPALGSNPSPAGNNTPWSDVKSRSVKQRVYFNTAKRGRSVLDPSEY